MRMKVKVNGAITQCDDYKIQGMYAMELFSFQVRNMRLVI